MKEESANQNEEKETGRGDDQIIYRSSSITIFRNVIQENTQNRSYKLKTGRAKELAIAIKALSPFTKSGTPSPFSNDDVEEFSRKLKNEYSILSCYFSSSFSSPEREGKRAVRKTIRGTLGYQKDENDRFQSIKLEFVNGISIREWMEENPLQNRSKSSPSWEKMILDRVRIAAGVACALADVHAAGVVHNDVAPSSFIIDDNYIAKRKRSWPVTIISFGLATYEKSVKDEGDNGVSCVDDDIRSLGHLLLKLFSFVEIDEQEKENKSNVSFHLPQDLPRSINKLLTNLANAKVNSSDMESYTKVRDVHEDLMQMIQEPSIFLFDPSDDFRPDRLHFAKEKLYGRSSEIYILQELCHKISDEQVDNSPIVVRSSSKTYNEAAEIEIANDSSHRVRRSSIPSENAEIVFVSGVSGVGKSELVRHACQAKITSELNGYYIHGKYDQLRRAQPYSALTAAFNELCNQILEQDQKTISEMSQKILMAVGTLGNVIADVIPNLEKIIGKQPDLSTLNMSGAELQNRFNFVFRMFIRAISNPSHPIVLVLDDLQWADTASLNLLNILLNDTFHHTSMLFVCSYRDNEVDHSHPLSRVIRGLSDRPTNTHSNEKLASSIVKKNAVTNIHLQHLSEEAVNNMASDTLRMSKRFTRSLSHLVHQKTEGNAFFVIQFLKSLHENSILSYSLDANRWEWNLDKSLWNDVPNDVVDLLSAKIQKFPFCTQEVLKVAAAIGSYFDEGEVKLVIDDNINIKGKKNDNNNKICCGTELETLVGEGLILKLCSSGYKFAHDRIQQAAYGLVDKVERTPLHLKIGRLKLRVLSEGKNGEPQEQSYQEGGLGRIDINNQKLLFATAHQLNRGSSLIIDQRERIEVAKLNLRAGKMAMNSSAFGPASVYLKAGIEILSLASSSRKNNFDDEKYRWGSHYRMTLDLYNNLAESEYCNDLFFEVKQAVDVVHKEALSIEDKVPTYNVLINSLSAQNMHKDAFTLGMEALSELGEHFPTKKVTMLAIVSDVMKTKLLLRGKTDAKILSLPMMTNSRKIMVMNILSRMYSSAIQASHEHLPLIINRFVKISLVHGICDISPFGFAVFGSMVSGVLGDIPSGTRYAELGLTMSEQFNTAQKYHSRLVGVLINSIWVWTKRSHELIEPCANVYHMGMDHGDHEFAMYGVWNLMLNSIFCGTKHLDGVVDDIRNYAQLMVELGQNGPLTIFVPIWQLASNLVGASEHPTILTGEAMDQEVMFKSPNAMAACDTAIFVLVLAYLFHDYKLAAEMSKRSKDASKIHPGMPTIWIRMFYHGLTALSMARLETKSSKRKWWLKCASKSMIQVNKWAKTSSKTFLHKYKLMKAEEASVLKGDKKVDEVIKAYDDAIFSAATSGFIHEEALANERAGLYVKDVVGDQSVGSRYLDRANELYVEWGAHSKTRP